MSLNRALSIFIVITAILAAGAAVSLILLTTYLHRATLELESGLHGVRLAEEMQITLRLYDGTADRAPSHGSLTFTFNDLTFPLKTILIFTYSSARRLEWLSYFAFSLSFL